MHSKLQDSVNRLLPHIDRKTKFVETFGQLYFPKHSKRRAKQLYKIRLALELLSSTDFEQLR